MTNRLSIISLSLRASVVSPSRKSRKKKPWRLRWPDEFRDEVLARLLELNEQRHKEELLTGASEPQRHGDTEKGKRRGRKKTKKSNSPQQELGFQDDQ